MISAILSFLLVADPSPSVQFNRDVRPILSDACFQCHGPDKARRKAGLRLDLEKEARRVLIPGKPEKSDLFLRITAKEASERMPPAKSTRQLTPREIQVLRAWIEQGARWEPHWAFVPPRAAVPPPVKKAGWIRNPIDAFILARLEKEGLTPSPEADRTTLIRRVTLDLTGLPPTLAEVDAFLADRSPGAYERLVERLLASPRYGERMAIPWLDGARYADSNGYQSDGDRDMWRWRDHVIDSFNANKPFDQFTIEQLAGDLLPRPTLEQRIATGFNRNHRGNAEGGIVPEEYAVEYVADRVETTAAVWMGLTIGCARCHDHKFDPISQKEFYRLFAAFNNVPEKGRAIKYGNSPPFIKAPTPRQQEKLQALQSRESQTRRAWEALRPALLAEQRQWEPKAQLRPGTQWWPEDGREAHFALEPAAKSPLRHVPGKVGQAGRFAGRDVLTSEKTGHFGFYDAFSLAVWVRPENVKKGTILSRMTDEPRGDGYALQLEDGKVQFNLVKRWLDDALRVETLKPGRWYHLTATYDGSRWASGVRLYIDGRPAKLKVNLDELNQSFDTKEPFRIGAGGGEGSGFAGLIDEVFVFARAIPAEESALLACAESIDEILAIPAQKRTPGQAGKLFEYHLTQAGQKYREARAAWLRASREYQAFEASLPTVMVMEEMPRPRDTHVLIRGQYDKPGEKVTFGVPEALPPLPRNAPLNRLGLARWLVSGEHPLTGRVAVNRAWELHFGVGLVKTSEDFGLQGAAPTHPELLDWLAVELVRSGWDIKRLHRLIVTSATYRQSSRVTPQGRERDPDNRLLARGPRFRLPAEMLRDQALAVSGLLVERLGGPSVKVYQPRGLWEEVGAVPYVRDRGDKLYRRGLYVYWKRTVSPPSLATFDAPTRESCVVSRSRTNTPLQALTLLNDVTFVEAARKLAERMLHQAHSTEDRLSLAFRLATARLPRADELAILKAGLQRHRQHYAANRAAALKLLAVGDRPRDPSLDVTELAACTAIASVILNLDEVVTRE